MRTPAVINSRDAAGQEGGRGGPFLPKEQVVGTTWERGMRRRDHRSFFVSAKRERRANDDAAIEIDREIETEAMLSAKRELPAVVQNALNFPHEPSNAFTVRYVRAHYIARITHFENRSFSPR